MGPRAGSALTRLGLCGLWTLRCSLPHSPPSTALELPFISVGAFTGPVSPHSALPMWGGGHPYCWRMERKDKQYYSCGFLCVGGHRHLDGFGPLFGTQTDRLGMCTSLVCLTLSLPPSTDRSEHMPTALFFLDGLRATHGVWMCPLSR